MNRYRLESSSFVKADPDGEYVLYADHVEAMKRIAGDSAQQAEPAVVRKTFIFDGVRNPDFVPLRIEFEPGYPEDVAFGTQRQMDRLKKWLDKFFAMRTAQSASPAALTDEQILEILKPYKASMLETYTRCFYEDEWQEIRLRESSVLAFARALLAASPADQVEIERLRRISWLIGSIFVHGNFVAETFNERELESLLRKQGTFWETLSEFDAAMSASKDEA